jgi:hypothetical protein
MKATRELFPDLAMSEEFRRANSLSLYLLEGMAANRFTRDPGPVVEELLEWLKGELRRSFQDVLTSVDRESAKRRIGT